MTVQALIKHLQKHPKQRTVTAVLSDGHDYIFSIDKVVMSNDNKTIQLLVSDPQVKFNK